MVCIYVDKIDVNRDRGLYVSCCRKINLPTVYMVWCLFVCASRRKKIYMKNANEWIFLFHFFFLSLLFQIIYVCVCVQTIIHVVSSYFFTESQSLNHFKHLTSSFYFFLFFFFFILENVNIFFSLVFSRREKNKSNKNHKKVYVSSNCFFLIFFFKTTHTTPSSCINIIVCMCSVCFLIFFHVHVQ